MSTRRKGQRLMAVAIGVAALVAWRVTLRASNVAWNAGDVFAGVGNGTYNVYDPVTGVLKDSFTTYPGSHTTGCAFDPTFTKFYGTYFDVNHVVVWDGAVPHTILADINTTSPPGSGDAAAQNASVGFAGDGSVYVGHAGGAVST